MYSPANAQETVFAVKAISGDEIELQNNRTLRISGIKAISKEAKDYLDELSQNKKLILQDAVQDRYGRTDAIATPGGTTQSIEESMLRAGLAFVYPTASGEMSKDWLAIENAARQQKRGYWSTHTDATPESAKDLIGKYAFIFGKVSHSERIKNKAYMYFGDKNSPDLKVTIAAKFLRPLKKRGLNVVESADVSVRIRGWIRKGSNGAEVTINDAEQIESF